MLRIDESPGSEVLIISFRELTEGAGEAGLPTVSPSLTMAFYELTKKRISSLPLI
jgi:CO/xanthine dehydrogenase Mo-binding subunit